MQNTTLNIHWKKELGGYHGHVTVTNSKPRIEAFRGIKSKERAKEVLSSRVKENILTATYRGELLVDNRP